MAAKKLKNKTKRLAAKNRKKLAEQKVKEEKSSEPKAESEAADKNDKTKESDTATSTSDADQKSKSVVDKKPRAVKSQKEKPQGEDKGQKSEDVSTTEGNEDTKANESEDGSSQKEEPQGVDEIAATETRVPEARQSSKSSEMSLSQRSKALFQKKKKKVAKSQEIKNKVNSARKKKTALMKRKQKLQNRGKKIAVPPKKRKIAQSLTTPKKTPTTTPGKRGRKPHLTEEDKENALYKSLKKRRQRKLKAMVGISKLDDNCYVCRAEGDLIFCDNKKCPRGYHITCVKKFKFPKGKLVIRLDDSMPSIRRIITILIFTGRWLCPWHYCNICNGKCKVAKCSKCVNSFCTMHVEENIFVTSDSSFICKDHKSEYLVSIVVLDRYHL